jgi:transcriptional regulator with XRE-family HTH domain
MRFGDRLRELRKEKHMSQIALAEKIGMERTYLSLLENGKKEVCLRMIELLAMGLEVPLRRVFWDL